MELDLNVLRSFALLWLIIIPTPGPNSIFIMHLALVARPGDVARAIAGNLAATFLYALATLLGLALVLSAAPGIRLAIYLLGGAYLLWCGIRLVRSGLAHRASRASNGDFAALDGAERPFAQGFLTAASNVQMVFFLTSIFASVGMLNSTPATGLSAVGVIVLGNGTYLSLLAGLLQRPAARAFYVRRRPVMEIAFGLLFLAFGARLVWRELAGWF